MRTTSQELFGDSCFQLEEKASGQQKGRWKSCWRGGASAALCPPRGAPLPLAHTEFPGCVLDPGNLLFPMSWGHTGSRVPGLPAPEPEQGRGDLLPAHTPGGAGGLMPCTGTGAS